MGYAKYNPAKHARDKFGRFASKGGVDVQRYRRDAVARVRTTTETYRRGVRRPTRVSQAKARKRWLKYTDEAHAIHGEFARSGRPRRLSRAFDPRYDEPISLQESLRAGDRLYDRRRGPGRLASKRSSKGRVVVERGYGTSYSTPDHKLRFPARKSRLRNFAGKKAATPKRRTTVRQVGYRPRHSRG